MNEKLSKLGLFTTGNELNGSHSIDTVSSETYPFGSLLFKKAFESCKETLRVGFLCFFFPLFLFTDSESNLKLFSWFLSTTWQLALFRCLSLALGQNFCLLERWFPRNIWCCGINFLTKLSNPMREKHVLPLCWKFSLSPLETCHVCRALKFDDCVIYQLYLGWFAKTTWNFRTSKHLSEETTFKILIFNFLYLILLFLFFLPSTWTKDETWWLSTQLFVSLFSLTLY